MRRGDAKGGWWSFEWSSSILYLGIAGGCGGGRDTIAKEGTTIRRGSWDE